MYVLDCKTSLASFCYTIWPVKDFLLWDGHLTVKSGTVVGHLTTKLDQCNGNLNRKGVAWVEPIGGNRGLIYTPNSRAHIQLLPSNCTEAEVPTPRYVCFSVVTWYYYTFNLSAASSPITAKIKTRE